MKQQFLFFTIVIIMFSCESKRDQDRKEQIAIEIKIDSIQNIINEKSLAHQFNDVVNLCNAGLEIDPENISLLENRALAYQSNEEYENAIFEFSKLINLASSGKSPHQAFYCYERGKCKYQLNDLLGSISDFDYCIQNGYALHNAYLARGIANLDLNSTDKACSDFSKSGENGNSNAYSYINKYCQ